MNDWWHRLSARDRLTLGWGGAIACLLLGYTLIWAPLDEARDAWRGRAQAAETSLRWMRATAQGLQGRPQAAIVADGRSLLARIDATAREAGLAGSLLRVEPVTTQQVRAQFQSAPFDALADWMDRVKREQGITVDDFSIRRAAGTGLVDARITLSAAESR